MPLLSACHLGLDAALFAEAFRMASLVLSTLKYPNTTITRIGLLIPEMPSKVSTPTL